VKSDRQVCANVFGLWVVALKDKWRSVSELSGAIAKCE
jgi:hypothetical protein